MKLEKLSAIGLSAYLEQAGVGDDEQVLERAAAWVHAQKPASVEEKSGRPGRLVSESMKPVI